MRLYIVRHAEPDYSIDSLTPAGHQEAKALAQWMAKLSPDVLYSSPMGRAKDTARYTGDLLGMPVHEEPWTAELGWLIQQEPYGRCSAWDMHGQTVRAWDPPPSLTNWPSYPPLDNPLFAEQFEDLKKNSDAFLARHGYVREGHRYRILSREFQKIVVFCHGGFGLTWLAHLLEIPVPLIWAGFFLSPSSVTTVLFDERRPGLAAPRCMHVAETAHLFARGLPVSISGVKANVE
ncbi:MAG: histidine phosphatase family protein [Phycisphaeraceae bacterium]|nr:histidine phosphatase family protein [Phycisphaeraceae bacterium]